MSTPHNRAEKGQIAETILLPGDPLSEIYCGTYLDDVVNLMQCVICWALPASTKGKRFP